MSEKISLYVADAVSNPIDQNDYMDFSNWNGEAYDVSKKIKTSELEEYLNGVLKTYYNEDGALPGHRTVDMSGFRAIWNDGNIILQSQLLDAGYSLWNTLSQERGSFRHDVGLDSGELSLANASGQFFLASDGKVNVDSVIEMKKQSGLGTIGKIGHTLTSYSILLNSGTDGIILNAETGKTVSVRINNNEKWKFNADKITSNDGVGMKIETYNGGATVYGFGIQASIFESIIPAGSGIMFEWGQGVSGSLTQLMTLNDDGVLNIPLMPTSAVGLSAGDLWSDSGTIKIV